MLKLFDFVCSRLQAPKYLNKLSVYNISWPASCSKYMIYLMSLLQDATIHQSQFGMKHEEQHDC